MRKVSCKEIKNTLSGYLDGELLAESNLLIKNHLQECQSCQEIFLKLKNLHETLRLLAQSSPSCELPVTITEKIASRLPKYELGIFTDPVMRQVTVVICMVLLLFVGGLKLIQPFKVVSPAGSLVAQVQGEAERFKDNQWQLIGPSFPLEPQSILKTNAGSNLMIQLQGGGMLFIKENSLLEIKGLAAEVEFSLNQGGLLVFVVKSSLERKFVIHTPAAQIQVYGTRFKVFVDEKSTGVEVLEGEVELKNPIKNEIFGTLKQFEKTLILRGQIQSLATKELLPEEIEALRSEFELRGLLPKVKKPITPRIILWREIKE